MKVKLQAVKQAILDVIAKSSVPEDFRHAQNTLVWVLKLDPSADQALQIAALAHDIERADEKQKIKRSDFDDYDTFKTVHANRSADILKSMLEQHEFHSSFIEDACLLVQNHEFGGIPRADLLKDADSLSYFEVNLPHYFKREGLEETKRRCLWGLRRLSDKHRALVNQIKYSEPHLNRLLKQAIQDAFSEAAVI